MGSMLAEVSPADGGQATSLCVVIDSDFGYLQDFSRSLRGAGIDTIQMLNSARLASAMDSRQPDVIFIDLSPTNPYDCVKALLTLKEYGFAGRVQLIGRCEVPFLENIRKIGVDASLAMLPVMQKPINFAAVSRIVRDQKLDTRPVPALELSLKAAIAQDLVSFLYQPKVDLKGRRIVGAECFARISHPQHGIISPVHFLAGAAEEDIAELARRALVSALNLSTKLDNMGVHIRIAINVSAERLLNFPTELVIKHRPQNDQWPGLLVEVTETQLLNKTVTLRDKLKELEKIGISLSIEHFGRGNSSFAAFRDLPFGEIKIDPSFTQGCASNKGNANICKSIIQIAHNFERHASAGGLETSADAQALAGLGCDIGQGFVFGKPMTEQHFTALVMAERTKTENVRDPATPARRLG